LFDPVSRLIKILGKSSQRILLVSAFERVDDGLMLATDQSELTWMTTSSKTHNPHKPSQLLKKSVDSWKV
jgi:hypothetical protein